jgi:hypothetical protein
MHPVIGKCRQFCQLSTGRPRATTDRSRRVGSEALFVTWSSPHATFMHTVHVPLACKWVQNFGDNIGTGLKLLYALFSHRCGGSNY